MQGEKGLCLETSLKEHEHPSVPKKELHHILCAMVAKVLEFQILHIPSGETARLRLDTASMQPDAGLQILLNVACSCFQSFKPLQAKLGNSKTNAMC